MTFDEIRAKHPTLGLAIYAIEPWRGVTLETYTPDGGVFTFRGKTEQDALDLAFPPESPAPEPPTESVFD